MPRCIFPATSSRSTEDRRIQFMANQPPDGIIPGPHDTEPSNPPPAVAAPDTAVQLERPARALLGWMPPELGERALLSNRLGVEPTGEQREQARRAREAVAARPAGADQQGLVAAPPPELAEHVERLRAQRASAAMFTEGWDIALVDLARVCAFQPWVFADSAVERVQEVKPEDIRSIAMVTLPTDHSTIVHAQFDQAKQAFVIASPNPNLKVTGSFAMMVQEARSACSTAASRTRRSSYATLTRWRTSRRRGCCRRRPTSGTGRRCCAITMTTSSPRPSGCPRTRR